MSHLQFILFLVPIVSGESFNLTYRRDENKFYLTCDVQNDSIDVSQVNFWINQTERIDISIRSERIFLSYNNIIVFELEPQYEGTFYCGTDSGGQSNGLGPFAAYPTDPQGIHNWYTVLTGENITLQCPFQLGALFQSYQVYWAPPNIVPDQYELGLSDDKYPLLTIANFQPPNSGIYDCHINITSPYDKLNWNVEGSVEARIALGSTHLDASDITGISFATFATIFALCALCCCCFCCCFPEATSLSPIIKGFALVTEWNTFTSECFLHAHIISDSKTLSTRPFLHVNTFSAERLRTTLGCCLKKIPGSLVTQKSFGFLKGLPPAQSYITAGTEVKAKPPTLVIEKESIGSGAFGSVFKGRYQGHKCAVKMLTHHAQQLTSGLRTTNHIQTEALNAFQQECDFIKTLQHENIVQFFANLTEPTSKLPVLIMELLDCNLKDFLTEQENLSLTVQLSMCHDISKGLEFLHSKNIIHRDLCDVNILLDKTGGETPKAKVADFGMSRILPEDYISTTLTALGHRVVYLPPEAPEDHYSYTLDIYAFGVITIQIVLVKTGFKTKSEVNCALEQISECHVLKSIVCSCLSDDRRNRPQAADIVSMINGTSDNDSIINCTPL